MDEKEYINSDKNDIDKFKNVFKYYKQKKVSPDLSNVLDLGNSKYEGVHAICKPLSVDLVEFSKDFLLEFKPLKDWRILTLEAHPGLFYIPNPFNFYGSIAWANRCIDEFTKPPHYTNLSQFGISHNQNWWRSKQGNPTCVKDGKSIQAMRWATLGYHHDWDSKEYDLKESSKIPNEVEAVCNMIFAMCGLDVNFKAEAAIVNFYPKGTSLGPHTDHSEPFKSAPLVSFSFGRSGVFLIGGLSKSIEPTAMYLHHGDILIMSGPSRHCYHALPMVLTEISYLPDSSINNNINCVESQDSNGNITSNSTDFDDFIACKCAEDVWGKINAYVKLLPGDFLKCPSCGGSSSPRQKISEDYLETIKYIKAVRVNFNVRQVFKYS